MNDASHPNGPERPEAPLDPALEPDFDPRSRPGLELGREIRFRVHDVASDGRGVGRLPDGPVVLTADVIDGEEVTASVASVRSRYVEADLVRVERPSIHRVTPPCGLFGRCGGCAYQHIDYPHQLELKRKQVRDALERVGGLGGIEVEPAVGSPRPYGYRNKIALHSIGRMTGGRYLGYRVRRGRELLPVISCPIASEEINRAVAGVRAFLEANRPTGRLPHQVVFRSDGRQAYQDWLPASLPDAPCLPAVLEIEEALLPGGRIRVPASAFYQTNFSVHRLLLVRVRDALVSFTGGGKLGYIVDAYAGVGVFLLLLAHLAEEGVGIETHRKAIREAGKNAEAAGIENLSFVRGEVAAALPRVMADLLERHDAADGAVLVDPPRAGLDAGTRGELCRRRPGVIVYVSCNPATLARDLKELIGAGYRVRIVVPFDMFPQTVHCETLAVLCRA